MIAATYLIYIVLWEGFILGGCGYVVFGLGHSGHWFWLAAFLSAAAYRPSSWRELWETSVSVHEQENSE